MCPIKMLDTHQNTLPIRWRNERHLCHYQQMSPLQASRDIRQKHSNLQLWLIYRFPMSLNNFSCHISIMHDSYYTVGVHLQENNLFQNESCFALMQYYAILGVHKAMDPLLSSSTPNSMGMGTTNLIGNPWTFESYIWREILKSPKTSTQKML